VREAVNFQTPADEGDEKALKDIRVVVSHGFNYPNIFLSGIYS